jgi:hypothetical protein
MNPEQFLILVPYLLQPKFATKNEITFSKNSTDFDINERRITLKNESLKALKAYVDFWVRLQNFSLFNFFKINL